MRAGAEGKRRAGPGIAARGCQRRREQRGGRSRSGPPARSEVRRRLSAPPPGPAERALQRLPSVGQSGERDTERERGASAERMEARRAERRGAGKGRGEPL